MRFKQKAAYVRSQRMPYDECPRCHHEISGITGASLAPDGIPPDPLPHPGAYTVCAYCVALLKFTKRMRLAAVAADEAARATAEQPMLRSLIEWYRAKQAADIAGRN